MATIANLDTNLRARTEKFDGPLKKSTAVLAGLSTGVAAAGAAIAAATAFAVKSASDFIKFGDELDKTAKRMQVTTEEVQTLGFAFEQNGGSMREMETSMRTLNRQMLNLERGSKNAKESFAKLGLSLEDLEPLSQADRFRVAAKALQGIENESIRSAVATDLFGRSGNTLLPLIKNLDETEQQFRDLGLVIGPEAIKVAADLTDEWNIMSRSVMVLGAELLQAFGPTLIEAVKNVSWLIREMAEGVGSLSDFTNAMNSGATVTRLAPGQQVSESTPNIINDIFGGFTEKTVEAIASSEKAIVDTSKSELRELKEIKRAQDKSVPALREGSLETIRFLDKLERESKREQDKQVEELKKQTTTLDGVLSALRQVLDAGTFGAIDAFELEPIR